MLVRTALGSCLALGLLPALPALASPEAQIAIFEAAPLKPAVRPLRRAKAVVPLPPARPTDLAASDVPAEPVPLLPSDVVSTARAEGFQLDAPPRANEVAVLPPLRPALPDEGRVAAEQLASIPLPPDAPSRLALAREAPPARIVPPPRPGFVWDADPVETAAIPDAPPRSLFGSLFNAVPPQQPEQARSFARPLDERIAAHAKLNDVPEDLVHRVIVRESKYDPRAVGRGGALGLMQIKHATARGLGYGGTASGLLDAETNLTYAVKYLAGAYRVAGGNYDAAVRNYARGYYYAAKRQGLVRTAALGRSLKRLRRGDALALVEPAAAP